MPKIPVKRRLGDLYVTGRPLTFDDGSGRPPIVVWLQKLNPIQLGMALRKANAARSRVRSVRSTPDSEEYGLIWSEVMDIGDRESLIRTLLAETVVVSQIRAEAQLAVEEEWADEDYLQGLKDAWSDGLAVKHLADPDEETSRVFAELQRFDDAAKLMTADDVATARTELESLTDEVLRNRAMDRQITNLAGTAWMEEIHRCELYYGTREPCDVCLAAWDEARPDDRAHGTHQVRYFGARDEVDELQAVPLQALLMAYQELSVDVTEGKDSGLTPDSENLSESQPEAETADGSGLVDATA